VINRKRMEGFKSFVSFNFALETLENYVSESMEFEEIKIEDSLGRIAFEDIYSPKDLPENNRSVVDGYALRSMDTNGASTTNPLELKIVGKIEAGKFFNYEIKKGECVEIYTGGIMPSGSDSVIMAEDTKREGDKIILYKQCRPFENVSTIGEDYRKGDIVVKKGSVVRSFHIGALASLGYDKIKVFRKARVGIISTGSELKDFRSNEEGIKDSTRPMLISAVKEMYAEPIDFGIVEDDEKKIKEILKKSVENVDLLVVTGGTSVGGMDLVPECINDVFNPGIVIHGIAMRPARTTGIAFHGKKPIFMVSGFPVASYISFTFLFRHFIKKFYSIKEMPELKIKGKLERRVANVPGTTSFVRVIVKKHGDEYMIEPLRLTGSGILSTLTKANGILVIDEKSEGYDEGQYVDVILTQPLEDDENGKNFP